MCAPSFPTHTHEVGISASDFFTLIRVSGDPAKGNEWSTSVIAGITQVCRKHSTESICQCLSVVCVCVSVGAVGLGEVGVPQDGETIALPALASDAVVMAVWYRCSGVDK